MRYLQYFFNVIFGFCRRKPKRQPRDMPPDVLAQVMAEVQFLKGLHGVDVRELAPGEEPQSPRVAHGEEPPLPKREEL